MSTELASVQSLNKRYGNFIAVNDISFSIQVGTCFGLLGPNGAGKTTTIKMMTTLLRPDNGEVTIADISLKKNPAAIRGLIGYVPQAISVDGTLTGLENLQIMAKLYNVPRSERRARIASIIDLLELGEAISRPANTFSGGMIRRLEIGQAILHRPRLLFMDEPTVGLDPMARRAVWEHIRELQKNFGLTVLLTTHYMEEAENLCDQIAIMNRGKIAAMGSLPELQNIAELPGASLDDLFTHFAGNFDDENASKGGFKDAARSRRTAKRLG